MIDRRKHQIRFGNVSTYDTFGLVPSEIPTVACSESKTEIVEIPYFSVSYDFTDALSDAPQGRREGEWHFSVLGGDESLRLTIENAIHGRHFDEIEIDGVIYNGRVYLSSWENHGNPKWAECVISYNLSPNYTMR